jgi:hypothetical protein
VADTPDDALIEAKPKTRSASYLSPHQMRRLDLACAPVRKAFPDYGPYLVGSVLERPDYRDVDVRVILRDKKFDRMFPKATVHGDAGAHDDVRWTFLCSAISHWLTDVSGLPVDFQIQRMTEANAYEKYQGKFRNPLGVRHWT